MGTNDISCHTITHVTVSVKVGSRDTTVSGCSDECQRNCKIYGFIKGFLTLHACYLAHRDNNAIKNHFIHSRAGACLNKNKTHFENSCVMLLALES